jgi:competence protein ComEC
VTEVVSLAASVPGSSIETGRLSGWLVGAYYGVPAFVYVLVALRRSSQRRGDGAWSMPSMPLMEKGVPIWVLAPVVGVAALLWTAAVSLPDDRMRVAFIDVGQGEGAFIVMPGGQQVLVDGGPDPVRMVQFVGERMPFQDRTIELVVLTHPHRDHVTGLVEVLRRYDVSLVLERELDFDSPSYEAWRKAVSDEGAELVQAQAGQVIAFGGGARLEVVSPGQRLLRGTASDVDNASVVLRLVYDDVSFLLTGDMFSEAEGVLVRGDTSIDSDVLKVGHHGSRSSSSAAFLDRVRPSVAVVSAGEDNRFGHPHAETLDALGRHVPEDRVYVTSEQGTVEFVTDGRRLEVKTER